jgi:type IV pilus assembly protein PilM
MAKKTIGVDVGSTSIKAAEVSWDGKAVKVLRAAEVPLPRGVVVAGEVRDIDALTQAVRELWKVGKFTGKSVSVGLGGSQILVRQVDLPWEPEEIFREALPLRLGSDLPIDPIEMSIDYHPLEEFMNGPVRMQRALIVASVNVLAENIADALVAAGLKLTRADFAPFALIRTAAATTGDGSAVPGAMTPGEEWDCEVIVEVGAQTTMIAIHHKGRPLFIRSVTAGSESVTRALADNLQISIEVAESVKQGMGIASVTENEPSDVFTSLSASQRQAAQFIMNTMAGSLVQVVRESVEYFLAASPSISGVSRVLLAGGGSLLPGYADRLSSELRAPVGMLAPLHGFAKGQAAENEDLDPRMAIAIGLGLEAK